MRVVIIEGEGAVLGDKCGTSHLTNGDSVT